MKMKQKRKLFALLVGIERYPKGIRPLTGCIADVNDVKDFLEKWVTGFDLRVETLTDEQAARSNIIDKFRGHLGQAGEQDVVLFYFGGHGSRVYAPEEFKKYDPDESHETLVCYDSRKRNGLDIADKELAILFAEVSVKHPHILAIFDCCHSGSGVRDVNDTELSIARYIEGSDRPRPIKHYLDGYFLGKEINIPRSKMVLMAACDRTEKAWENTRNRGVFTYNLFKILREFGGKISYADLHPKIRSAVLASNRNQNPQMECYEGFNAYGLFLDGSVGQGSHRFKVYFKTNSWFINCGVLHGIPDDPLNPVRIVIYIPGEQTASQTGTDEPAAETEIEAHLVSMALQESKIELDQPGLLDIKDEYRCDINTFAVPPLEVYLNGEERGVNSILEASKRDYSPFIHFRFSPSPAPYEVKCCDNRYSIFDGKNRRLIFETGGYTEEKASTILSQLDRIERWNRMLKLGNPGTRLPQHKIDFSFYRLTADDKRIKHEGGEINLVYGEKEKETEGIPFELRVKNNIVGDDQKLFFTLLHFSPDFGIQSLEPCRQIKSSHDEIILYDDHQIIIEGEKLNESIDTFLLLVTTRKVDEYLFTQADIGKEFGVRSIELRTGKEKGIKKTGGDWFTRAITVKTTRK